MARNGGLCRQNSGKTEEGGRRAPLIVRPLSPPGLLKIRLTSLVSPFLSLLQSLTFLCASTLSDRLEKDTVFYVQKCFLFFFKLFYYCSQFQFINRVILLSLQKDSRLLRSITL